MPNNSINFSGKAYSIHLHMRVNNITYIYIVFKTVVTGTTCHVAASPAESELA